MWCCVIICASEHPLIAGNPPVLFAKKPCTVDTAFDPGLSVIFRQVSRSRPSPIRVTTACSGYAVDTQRLVRTQQAGGKMAMRRAAVLSDEPKEEADGHAPAPLSAPGALSSPAQPGGWSVAAVPRTCQRAPAKVRLLPYSRTGGRRRGAS